jgi:hypothetical protein
VKKRVSFFCENNIYYLGINMSKKDKEKTLKKKQDQKKKQGCCISSEKKETKTKK